MDEKKKKDRWKSLYYQNTCCAETKIFQQQCQYNVTDTRASCIARSSATMVTLFNDNMPGGGGGGTHYILGNG